MEPFDPLSSLRAGTKIGRISVEHLSIRCHCGVTDAERSASQQILGNLTVDYAMADCVRSDGIEDAVDYGEVASCVKAFEEKACFHLLESLASAICSHVLDSFPRAMCANLQLRKDSAPFRGSGTFFTCSSSLRRSLAVLGLGSNLGDRAAALGEAGDRIGTIPHTRLLLSSSLHRTAPLLLERQREFFNKSLLIETFLTPVELLEKIQSIEYAMGRVRGERYGPRLIDIDLLLFEGFRSMHGQLSVPHPQLRHRRFWLEELADFHLRVEAAQESVFLQECEKIADGECFTKAKEFFLFTGDSPTLEK
jgi:2-amino-4-hydroxy-6-hydroxymethyldihydropteridine diphosphokinase/dihydroneopterin aldolase